MLKPIGILFLIFYASSLQAQNWQELYKKSLPSIVKILVTRVDGSSVKGTGFFIDERTIISCHHVVKNVSSIYIVNYQGLRFTADSILVSNEQKDIVKFTVKEKNKTWLKLNENVSEIGEAVFSIGNPDDYDFSLSTGIISGIRIKNGVKYIQTTTPCSTGNSGGPLINSKGLVEGVMYFVSFLGQNLNLATANENMLNMSDDNTIQEFWSHNKNVSKAQMDSIIEIATSTFSKKEYLKVVEITIPYARYADTAQAVKLLVLTANAYFFHQDYMLAIQYFDYLINTLSILKQKDEPGRALNYTQAYQNQSLCYFNLGANGEALELIQKSIMWCKQGLKNDDKMKEGYEMLIKSVYVSKAIYEFALKKNKQACLSWNMAKEYGQTGDEYGFDALCK